MFCKKTVLTNLEKFTVKHLYCVRVSFLIQETPFFQKKWLQKVFSCQFWKICKNTFSYRMFPVTVIKLIWNYWHQKKYNKLSIWIYKKGVERLLSIIANIRVSLSNLWSFIVNRYFLFRVFSSTLAFPK